MIEVKNRMHMLTEWTTLRQRISPISLLSILLIPGTLCVGLVLGKYSPSYEFALAGVLVLVIVVLLRMPELTLTLVIAVHLYIDWYLGLHIAGILLAMLLLFVYYFGRSVEHPWAGPRVVWLWIAFLALTLYPAIKGGRYMLYDLATYYPSDILGAFLLFWLGGIVARDVSALRRLFQLLSLVAALVAIHTIIQAVTGNFLLSAARENDYLASVSNYAISGTNASRAGSFFLDPNWNGTFLATMFFLPLGLFFECRSLPARLLYLAQMALLLIALLFTYSNGSWVALLGGAFMFVFWVGSQRHRFLFVFVIAVAALLIVGLFSSQLAIQLQRVSSPTELSLRQGAWLTAIQVIKAYPLFGVGLGSQVYFIMADPYRVPEQYVPLAHPHNAYLQWGAMAGLPVLGMFLLLLGCGLWLMWRNWRMVEARYRPLFGGGITAIIALSINSWSIDGWTNAVMATIGWLIVGAVSSPLIARYLRLQAPGTIDQVAQMVPVRFKNAARTQPVQRDGSC